MKQIKIRSVQANSLYQVNEGYKDARLDLGSAVINDSIFAEYVVKHGVTVTRKNKSQDFVVMKYEFGVKPEGEGDNKKLGKTSQQLREHFYENGATITWEMHDKNGEIIEEKTKTIRYKMLLRGTGQAKEGECLFIREDLHRMALNYITMDLFDKMPDKNAMIVEMSAYSTMIMATAKGYIQIPLENMLIIEDQDVSALMNAVSVKTKDVEHTRIVKDFTLIEECINKYNLTFSKKKNEKCPNLKLIKRTKADLESNGIIYDDLPTKEVRYPVSECYVDKGTGKKECTNTLWDGMGLIDDSIFPESLNGEDMDGFIYCRSHFFKSCLFRGNVQDYFRDRLGDKYNTATVPDMFGNNMKVSDIKVIVTHNSIKWIKFVDLMGGTERNAYEYYKQFMKKHKDRFAVVKTAHASKWGDLQRSSFQINNSLPTTDKRKLQKIAKTSIDYINSLKLDHEAFIKHLEITGSERYSINNVLIALDNLNDRFKYTDYFKEERDDIISRFKKEQVQIGKLLQVGDNLTICGNPVELMEKIVKSAKKEKFDPFKESCFKVIPDGIQCYTTRFRKGERIAGFRSPHNSPNNVVHLVNVSSDIIQKFFPKLGDNVIIINGIGTDVQSRLNGQDLDTDAIYATNQTEIVTLARKAYMEYPTILNDIELKGKSEYSKDMKSYAKMDNSISSSQYAIGNSSNIAQLALSYFYDSKNADEELKDVFIICSVLAQVAIDGCKREYNVKVNSELYRLKKLECMNRDDKKYPEFYAKVQKKNCRERKRECTITEDKIRHYNCPMDILYQVIDKGVIDRRKDKASNTKTIDIKDVFSFKSNIEEGNKKYKDSKQYQKIISIVNEFDGEMKKLSIDDEDYHKNAAIVFDDCMDKINKLSISEVTMSSLIDYALMPNGKIRDRMLVALYDRDPEKFIKCFKKAQKLPK